jgi:hypothetical protein
MFTKRLAERHFGDVSQNIVGYGMIPIVMEKLPQNPPRSKPHREVLLLMAAFIGRA